MQFSHLHNHTQFSLLDGASSIARLYNKATEDNMPAIAITDHGNMFGVFKFVAEAAKYNTKEHPDTINDGFFMNRLAEEPKWGNLPASYHNGACGFSFADGHSEIKRWLSRSSKYRVAYQYPNVLAFDGPGKQAEERGPHHHGGQHERNRGDGQREACD